MKVPTWLLSIVCGGFAAWLAWMSLQIVDLKRDVAVLTSQMKLAQNP